MDNFDTSRFANLEIDGIDAPALVAPEAAPVALEEIAISVAPEAELADAVRAVVTPAAPVPVRAPVAYLTEERRRQIREEYDRANGTTTILTAPAAPAPVAVSPAPATTVVDRNRLVAVETHNAKTGAVVFWNGASGAKVTDYLAACAAEDITPAAPPSREVAFGRACKGETSDTVKVAASKGKATWVRAEAGLTEIGALNYGEQLRLRLSMEDDTIEISRLAGSEWIAAERPVLAERLARTHREALETLTAGDITDWLVSLVESLGGVALRGRGGVYYVPASGVATYQAATRVVAGLAAGAAYEIPALSAASTVEAVTAALAAEVTGACDTVEGKITAGEFGTRAARSRMEEMDGLLGKVAQYEGLFGVRLDAARARIAGTRGKLAEVTTRTGNLEID